MIPGTQRWYRDLGDGPPCPENAEHGRLYQVKSGELDGAYWCPVTQNLFAIGPDGTAGERVKRPTPLTESR